MKRPLKKPTGRPTKYRPMFIKIAKEYFLEETNKGNYPSIAGLAYELKVHKDQLYEWEKKYEGFHDALVEGRQLGERVLTNKALNESWNSGFCKFLAINNFGMVSENSKVESNNTHNFPSGINITFIDGKEPTI